MFLPTLTSRPSDLDAAALADLERRAPPTSVASSAAILVVRAGADRRSRRRRRPSWLCSRRSSRSGSAPIDQLSEAPMSWLWASPTVTWRAAPMVLTCAAPTVRVSAAPTVSTRAAADGDRLHQRRRSGCGSPRSSRSEFEPIEIVSSTPTVSERFLPTLSVSFDPIVTVRSTPTFVVLLLPTSSSRFTPTECLALLSMRSRLVVLHELRAVVLHQQRVVLLRLEVDELRPGLVLEHQLVVAAAPRRGVRLPPRLRRAPRQPVGRHLRRRCRPGR